MYLLPPSRPGPGPSPSPGPVSGPGPYENLNRRRRSFYDQVKVVFANVTQSHCLFALNFAFLLFVLIVLNSKLSSIEKAIRKK